MPLTDAHRKIFVQFERVNIYTDFLLHWQFVAIELEERELGNSSLVLFPFGRIDSVRSVRSVLEFEFFWSDVSLTLKKLKKRV